jgi:hypothetical protein
MSKLFYVGSVVLAGLAFMLGTTIERIDPKPSPNVLSIKSNNLAYLRNLTFDLSPDDCFIIDRDPTATQELIYWLHTSPCQIGQEGGLLS